MPDDPKQQSWWQTTPVILTAIAAVVTALGGLIAAVTPILRGSSSDGNRMLIDDKRNEGSACNSLWYRRNKIYFDNGYCFKTERSIKAFGNKNCRFPVEADVPMSPSDRAQIDLIRTLEQQNRCQN